MQLCFTNLSGEKEMITKVFSIVLLMGIAFNACQMKGSANSSVGNSIEPDSVLSPSYAKGFEISYYPDYKKISLLDPWNTQTPAIDLYLTADSVVQANLSKQGFTVVKTPVQRWVAMSSTMINYAHLLHEKESIVGVAEPQYISDDYVTDRISKGEVKNIGMAFAPNTEIIVDLVPDFVMASPFKEDHFASIRSAGIPVVTNSDYLENTPLGRAEWLVFVSSLFDKEKEGLAAFKLIENEYLSVQDQAQKASVQPTVFTGHLYQGIWHTPAGESYMANFFNHSGSNYIYKATEGTGSLSLDFESILVKAIDVDYWVMIINEPKGITYQSIQAMDSRYADFTAFKKRNIIVTNSAYSLYFEEGVLKPQVVLKDLVFAFHPELFPNYKPVYFYHLNN